MNDLTVTWLCMLANKASVIEFAICKIAIWKTAYLTYSGKKLKYVNCEVFETMLIAFLFADALHMFFK